MDREPTLYEAWTGFWAPALRMTGWPMRAWHAYNDACLQMGLAMSEGLRQLLLLVPWVPSTVHEMTVAEVMELWGHLLREGAQPMYRDYGDDERQASA